jgi:type II secretory pathway component PulJ
VVSAMKKIKTFRQLRDQSQVFQIPGSKRGPRHGFILMEVILAAGIFALAGVSLATALNSMAKVFVRARTEAEVRIQLETRLVQARLRPLVPMKEKSEPDEQGIVYEKEVVLMDMANDDKIVLTNLYRLSIAAHWKVGAEEQVEQAEVYVYQP